MPGGGTVARLCHCSQLVLFCRQNTELAKLRQELSKVNKELVEKSEASRQEEQQRKALEAKAATFEKQVLQLQVSSGGSQSRQCLFTGPGVISPQAQQTAGDVVSVWGLNLDLCLLKQ